MPHSCAFWRAADPFMVLPFLPKMEYRMPRPCVRCKGGSNTTDAIGSTTFPGVWRFCGKPSLAGITCSWDRGTPCSTGEYCPSVGRLKSCCSRQHPFPPLQKTQGRGIRNPELWNIDQKHRKGRPAAQFYRRGICFCLPNSRFLARYYRASE